MGNSRINYHLLAMKKIFLPLFVYAFTLFSLQSCDPSDFQDDPELRGTSTRNFSFTKFDELEAGNSFYVNVKAGSTYSVSATGEQNDLDDLAVFTEDGELVMRYKEPWKKRRYKMTIDITMPSLSGVEFSGAVKSEISGFENAKEIDFELSGASKCNFNGTARLIEMDLSGASYLNLKGNGQFLDGELSGASEVRSFEYAVQESNIKLSGASDAKILVTGFLNVDASGASRLRYQGNPKIQKKVSGGSSVSQD